MSTVTFTTRANLVAGNPENIADVADCLDKLQVGVNDCTTVATSGDGQWSTLLTDVFTSGSLGSGTYLLTNGSLVASGVSAATVPRLHIPSATDYAITSRTTKLRVQATIATNVSPTVTAITFGLYVISGLGASAANAVTYTLGAAVSGSTVALTPSSGLAQRSASTAFNYSLLASGSPYVLGFNIGASLAGVHGTVELQIQNV